MNKTKNTHQERGAVLIMVAIFLIVIVAFLALAVDMNHLYVVRNELQNAADAGALAGAGALYDDLDGSGPLKAGELVNTNANQIAYNAVILNFSDKAQVEVTRPPIGPEGGPWMSGDNIDSDIERGNWSFTMNQFTPSDETIPADLWGISSANLDLLAGPTRNWSYQNASGNYPVDVNAVRVVARRKDTPAFSFFARIFGFKDFIMEAEAVAYVGYTGSLGAGEADQPIVICESSILDENGNYTCNVGRMINSSDDGVTSNTAAWSNLVPSDSCDSTNTNEVRPKICNPAGANSQELHQGDLLGSINGQLDTLFADLEDCWLDAIDDTGPNGQPDGIPDHPYRMNLPVVLCGDHATGNCPPYQGAVTVNLMLLTGELNKNQLDKVVPKSMTDSDWDQAKDWAADEANCSQFNALVGQDYNSANLPDPDNLQIWQSDRWGSNIPTYEQPMADWDCFVSHYNMINTDNKMAPLENKSMYFMPDCAPQEPKGSSGGPNYGVRSDRPVLVE